MARWVGGSGVYVLVLGGYPQVTRLCEGFGGWMAGCPLCRWTVMSLWSQLQWQNAQHPRNNFWLLSGNTSHSVVD